jgi:hypothetical protein
MLSLNTRLQPTVPASIVPALPDEMWLYVADLVSEWQDRAALCLGHPRVGLTSIRSLKTYKDPLLAIAIALWYRSATSVLTEQCFRKYAGDSEATEEGCHWLTRASERHGVALALEVTRIRESRTATTLFNWHLVTVEVDNLRPRYSHVRAVQKDGAVLHYDQAERMVRSVYEDGDVVHLEGDKGAERRVRQEYPNGKVDHFEGEKGTERRVRSEFTDGKVYHYDIEQRVERVTYPDGNVCYYEGENGAERKVRETHPSGAVFYYEGESGAERKVHETSAVIYFESDPLVENGLVA